MCFLVLLRVAPQNCDITRNLHRSRVTNRRLFVPRHAVLASIVNICIHPIVMHYHTLHTSQSVHAHVIDSLRWRHCWRPISLETVGVLPSSTGFEFKGFFFLLFHPVFVILFLLQVVLILSHSNFHKLIVRTNLNSSVAIGSVLVNFLLELVRVLHFVIDAFVACFDVTRYFFFYISTVGCSLYN